MARNMAFVYVASSQSRTIDSFHWELATGAIRPIETVPVPGAPSPFSLPLAVDRTLGVLWASIRYEPWMICTYSINRESGKLTYVGSGPAADNTCYMASDKNSRFLLTASFQGSKIAVSTIGAQGVPLISHQVIETAPKSHCILAAPGNDYVLSTCLGGDIVNQWKFDQISGALTPNDPPHIETKRGSGPRHVVFHPNGKFVYLINQDDNTVQTFTYSTSKGFLSEKQTIALTANEAESSHGRIYASAMHITHNGKYLFVAERGASVLTTLRVDPTEGTVSIVEQKRTESQPWSFALSPDDRYLCATGFLSDRISVYEIDAESGERKRTVSEGRVGNGASWVEVWY